MIYLCWIAADATGELTTPAGSGDYSSLSVRQLQLLLDTAGIDYRDCFDKQDLVDRLKDNAGNSKPYSQVMTKGAWLLSDMTDEFVYF